jgi:NAD(P)H-hydrate repair Nnr-like enzyme with NAD(P)H-hydrate dehydratase domain
MLNAFKVAVDVPTGIDSDTGEALGTAVKANLTITFYKAKVGLEKAKEYVGELLVKDIGLPKEFENYAGPGDISLVLKHACSQKHIKEILADCLWLVEAKPFLVLQPLVALAALRTGIDLAYVAAPSKTAHDIAAMTPDLITIKLDGDHLNMGNVPALKTHIKRVDAVVIGPGLGLHAETKDAVKALVEIC